MKNLPQPRPSRPDISTRLIINALAVDLVDWQHQAIRYRELAQAALGQLAEARQDHLRLEQRLDDLRSELRRYTAAQVRS